MSKIVKTCDFCGKEFTAHRVDMRFCSSKCHVAYHHAKRAVARAAKRAETKSAIVKEMGEVLLLKCKNCGREFTRERTQTAYRTKYCSAECSKEAHAKQHRERDRKIAATCYNVPITENGRFPSDEMCSALAGVMRKYPVLSAEEEAKLMLQSPERRRELLVLHNVRLVFGIAKRWACRIRFLDADDMIQIGLIALISAAEKFKGECRFCSYARRVVESSYKMEMRHSYLLVDANCDSLNKRMDVVGEDGEEGGELLDYVYPLLAPEYRETSLAEWIELRDGIDFAKKAAKANFGRHMERMAV